MEKSKNYNFNLPNSENDEIADINDISDNFRIIDEIMNETDQTFEPTSTKAASGKAVNEAISGIQPIDENTEFIFDGGDVDGGVSVDIVVDTVLSKTSNNPIANKPVATKFSEILGAIEQAKKDILLSAYPVGALFMSTENISPATLFGGTWERIKGRFIWGIDDGENAGYTGGEATHTLTVDEMPSHEGHLYSNEANSVPNGPDSYYVDINHNNGLFQKYNDRPYVLSTGNELIIKGFSKGGNQPHNNMPPYYGSYIWRRTA